MILTYDHIVGHERPIRILRASAGNKRIAHAYLFAGPDGIGKRTTAVAFGAALNCATGPAAACGACISCKKIADGNHPDFNIIEADGKFIKIEQVRAIAKSMQFAPYEGRSRVTIFLDAEKMNLNAANALLKTLEEPKSDNVLILVTSNPQQLLPTILSRCQRVNFSPLAPDQIEKIVTEKVTDDPSTVRLLGRLSGGSIGWVMQADVDSLVERRRDLLLALAELNPQNEIQVAQFADKMMDQGEDLETTFELLKTFLRDSAVLLGTGSEDKLINLDIVESIRQYSSRFTPDRLLSMGRSVGYAQRLLLRNVNKSLVAMALALELVHPSGSGFDAERMPR